MRCSQLVAIFLLLVSAVASAPNGTSDSSTTVSKDTATTPAPSTTSESPSTKSTEDEEQPASVEQVPPPAPLITESAKQGYRMPGLYALGTQPFYLQRDPVTGAVDFSIPSQVGNSNHRYSSKITNSGHDPEEYDDEIAINDGEESDQIDRKDTLGPNTSNNIKFNNQDYYSEKKPAKERFPMISSSYANTKVQGMGVSKQPPRHIYSTTPSGPSPSYYNIRSQSTTPSTTESILDFWPTKSPSIIKTTTTTVPPFPSEYDYYEETPMNEEKEVDMGENEDGGHSEHEHTSSTTSYKDISATQTPITTGSYHYNSYPTTQSTPSFPSERPDVYHEKPYEEPFRPIYGTVDVPEIVNENIAPRPKPPSIYDLPPNDQNSPSPFSTNNRPNTGTENKRPLTVISPPPYPNSFNQQSSIVRQQQPQIPSIMQKPPNFEPPKYHNEERIDGGERDKFPVRPLQIDSQGWKQATYTETPPSSVSTTKVQFPQGETEETFTTLPYPPSIKQILPQGYEPQRPSDYRLQEKRPRPQELPQNFRPPPSDSMNKPYFENGRPHYERPGPVPVRHQFDPASIPEGVLRIPPSSQSRPNQPPRRSDTRPTHFGINYNNPQFSKFNGQKPKDHAQYIGNNPENLEAPVVLPQFRPNANIPPNAAIGNFRVPNAPNRRPLPPPGYFDRGLYPPPPPPPVGRRVGSQVSTLQMMQHGAFPRPSAREDAPFPNPKPPVTTYEVRPAKYGPQQQGSEERPVFVVYANSGENQQQSDILVGTQGAQRPLPPSHLTEEEPVLNKKPSYQTQHHIPIKADFPYALEKPTVETKKVSHVSEEIEKEEEEVNIIPNLQDYMPLGLKSGTQISTSVKATTQIHNEGTPPPTENTRVVSIVRPQNKNEFTVSAVMHTGSHQGGAGTSSIMVVAPQHRNPVQSAQTQPPSTSSHESFNFQAPFHPSANVAPSPGNGWSAVKGSTDNSDSVLRPGSVIDRADIMEEMHTSTSHANGGNKFDIENFKPELIGGFKPIYSFPEESTVSEKKPQQQTTEREEKRI